MPSLPFAMLYLLWLGLLLAARFGIVALGPPPAEAEAARAEQAVMAIPPKPEGMKDLPKPGDGGDGSGDAVITRAYCDKEGPNLQDLCLQTLARQQAPHDPEGALAVCTGVGDVAMREECQSDVAETVAPINKALGISICDKIASVKWRGQCHFGMGLAVADTDPAWSEDQCDHAEAFRDFCRHDVIGTVALTNLDFAVSFCSKEEGDELTRKTCWHGIGKYLARRSMDEAAAACARATPDWHGNCMHGAGWGAAERDPDAALASCATQGEFVDNCRQGVAHELKRADPSRAVSICESIATERIRNRCLDFVRS